MKIQICVFHTLFFMFTIVLVGWLPSISEAQSDSSTRKAADVIHDALLRSITIQRSEKNASDANADAELLSYARGVAEVAWRELLRDDLPVVNDQTVVDNAVNFPIVLSSSDRNFVKALVRMQVRSVVPRLAYLKQFPPMTSEQRTKLIASQDDYLDSVQSAVEHEFEKATVEGSALDSFKDMLDRIRVSAKRAIENNTFSTRYNKMPEKSAIEQSVKEFVASLPKSVEQIRNAMRDKGSGSIEFQCRSLAIRAQKRFSVLTVDDRRNSFDPLALDAKYKQLVKDYRSIAHSLPSPVVTADNPNSRNKQATTRPYGQKR